MDVVCGRCRAEYEFDDALISERGTTVRCTNCGLQFKVFPPVGTRAPEVWRVFESPDSPDPSFAFESLSALQRAIAAGNVGAQHFLARGDEIPRPLGEIVELQALLRQPLSVPPPAVSTDEEYDSQAVVPAADDVRDSDSARMNQTARQASLLSDDEIDPEHAIVPSEHPEAADVPEVEIPRSTSAPSKPRIRSALSLSNVAAVSAAADSGEELPISRRPSLSTTLAGGPSSLAPSSDRDASRQSSFPPPSSGRSSGRRSSYPPPPSSDKPLQQPQVAPQVPAVRPVEASEPEPQSDRLHPIAKAPSVPASLRTPKASAEATDIAPGQLTPTPLGMRAYTSASVEPQRPMAAAPAKRRATGLVVIVSIVLGGAAIAVWSQKDRLSADSSTTAEAPPKPSSTVTEDLTARVKTADEDWWRARLDDTAPYPAKNRLSALAEQLQVSGAAESWEMVHLLRMQGNLKEARALAVRLSEGPESQYALSMLDLVEESEPPWPLILERLKNASAGEREPYLARVAYIYSLLQSDSRVLAEADFETFGRLSGAQDSPLYQLLKGLLEADAPPGEANAADPQPSSVNAPEDPPSNEPEEPEATATANTPTESEAQDAPKGSEAEKKEAPTPTVSSATKKLVAEADALWRSGDRDAAVAKYRTVVQKIGTSHFLGQRAAARIALAEREKAALAGRGENQ